jgi:hypothetical protein
LLKAAQINLAKDFVVDLLKVVFLLVDGVRNRLELFLKGVHLLLVNWNVDLPVVVISSRVKLQVIVAFACLFNGLSYSFLEVTNLVVYENLIHSYFLFEIAHVAFVNKLQNP